MSCCLIYFFRTISEVSISIASSSECAKTLSKLQRGSESNSAAIFQLNELPGKSFLSFRLGFVFLEIGKKGGNFGLRLGPIIGPW